MVWFLGAQIKLESSVGKDDRSCASHSDADAALELAMTVNTDSENAASGSNEKQLAMTVNIDSQNAPSGSNEKQKHINSGNNISEGSCSRSQIMPTSNLFRTTLCQEVF